MDATPAAALPWMRVESIAELAQDLGADVLTIAVDAFAQDARALSAQLAEAHAAGDETRARRIAHSLKGLFRQFGLVELGEVALSVEKGPFDAAQAAVGRIRDESGAGIDAVTRAAQALAAA